MEGLLSNAATGEQRSPRDVEELRLRQELDRRRVGPDPWILISAASPSAVAWLDVWIDLGRVIEDPSHPAFGRTGYADLAFFDGERMILPPAVEGRATHWLQLRPDEWRLAPISPIFGAAASALPVMAIPRAVGLRLMG